MKANLLLLISLALVLVQCKKREPAPPPTPTDPLASLPAETQTGAGTFGCLINGKVFKAPYATSARADWQTLTRLGVSSSLTENGISTTDATSILLALNGSLANNQSFLLISSALPYPIFTAGVNQFWAASAGRICQYEGGYIKTGKVELVKFDGVARIASGRFAFTLYEPGGGDTLKVTNGRFDVKF
jgi:hypothetical protein